MGDKQIKTVGYLLKHYQNSQCYEQYVNLNWLLKQIDEIMESDFEPEGDLSRLKIRLENEREG